MKLFIILCVGECEGADMCVCGWGNEVVEITNVHHCNVLRKVRPHILLYDQRSKQKEMFYYLQQPYLLLFASAILPTKHITSEDIIASGIDLLGFFASSPVVAIISNPMKA